MYIDSYFMAVGACSYFLDIAAYYSWLITKESDIYDVFNFYSASS